MVGFVVVDGPAPVELFEEEEVCDLVRECKSGERDEDVSTFFYALIEAGTTPNHEDNASTCSL